MAQASAVVDVLKRELKARGVTYAEVARRIGMSEPSVKRMFAQRNFTLARIDKICTAVGIEFTELTRGFNREEHLLTRLTEAQEREIVDDPKLFMAAVCTLNLMSFEEILAAYAVSEAELTALLLRLDKIGVIELLPNNRFKLRVARTFAWIPNGPIQRSFKNHAHEFFDSDFGGRDESMLLLNARLSHASVATLIEKLKRIAREVSEQHAQDAALPSGERHPISVLLACRPWHPDFMQSLARKPVTGTRRVQRR